MKIIVKFGAPGPSGDLEFTIGDASNPYRGPMPEVGQSISVPFSAKPSDRVPAKVDSISWTVSDAPPFSLEAVIYCSFALAWPGSRS